MKDYQHLGARAAGLDIPLAQAEAQYPEMTPYQKGVFRRGYANGRVSKPLNILQDLRKYMRRDDLNALAEDLTVLLLKYEQLAFEEIPAWIYEQLGLDADPGAEPKEAER